MLFIPNGRLLGALQSLIAGVYKGPFSKLQTFFAVSHDTSGGRFVLEDDQLRLVWPNAKDEPVYKRLDAILSSIVTEAGGSYVKNPLAGTVMGHQPATAHPLGGAGMGRERSDGVVNHKGQVFDAGAGRGSTAVHEGLYVVDGAVMPRSLGVNPLLTITALAERALIHMAQDYRLTFDDVPVKAAPVAPADLGSNHRGVISLPEFGERESLRSNALLVACDGVGALGRVAGRVGVRAGAGELALVDDEVLRPDRLVAEERFKDLARAGRVAGLCRKR